MFERLLGKKRFKNKCDECGKYHEGSPSFSLKYPLISLMFLKLREVIAANIAASFSGQITEMPWAAMAGSKILVF